MSQRNSKKSNRLVPSIQKCRGLPNHFAHEVPAAPPTSSHLSPSSFPSEFIQLDPLPPEPSPSELSTQYSALRSMPIDTNLYIFQQKLDTLMKTATPGDPALKSALDTYAALFQAVTLERMTASLASMSETALVETNNQITTLLRIIERTNSRYSREKRDQEAQERRLIRDQQRKERQAQRELENIAKEQRRLQRAEAKKEREEQLEFKRIQREEQLDRMVAVHNEFRNKESRKPLPQSRVRDSDAAIHRACGQAAACPQAPNCEVAL